MTHHVLPDLVDSLVDQCELHLTFENQVEIGSAWTARVTHIDRGYPAWVGSFRLIETKSRDEWMAVNAFLRSIGGRADTFDAPLNHPTMATSERAEVNARSLSNDGVLTLGLNTTAALETGMLVGSGDRVYSVRSIPAAGSVILDPQRPLALGSVISPVETIRSRLLQAEQPRQTYDPTFRGPWSVSYREA